MKILQFFCAVLIVWGGGLFGERIPVVLIHRGDPHYLEHCIWQAKQNNEEVILIGDASNDHYPGVAHYFLDDYFEEAGEFAKTYQHKSTSGYEYELLCFQRWFVLKEFMKTRKLDEVFYCDSDVMLYCNVTDEGGLLRPIYASIICWDTLCSGHSSFFSHEGLSDLCEYFMTFYHEFEERSPQYHHISDMYLLNEFALWAKKQGAVIDNLKTLVNGGRFDENMGAAESGYRMKKGIKKVHWIDGRPYVFNKQLNQWVWFKGLHFQGRKKCLMKNYRARNKVSACNSSR